MPGRLKCIWPRPHLRYDTRMSRDDMPSREEFVAHQRTEDEVCEVLAADGLIYQTVDDLLQAGKTMNPNISRFDASCFDGDYVTATSTKSIWRIC